MSAKGKGYEKGKYKCKKCGNIITLDSFSNRLPTCSDCQSTKYSRIVSERH
jgi:Zn finger protein HypA/HybF involved in hydrogenase expression